MTNKNKSAQNLRKVKKDLPKMKRINSKTEKNVPSGKKRRKKYL